MKDPESEPFFPTAEQLVPDPPPGITQRQKIAFYTADLRKAIGPEFIADDPDPSPTRAHPPRYRYRLDHEKRFPESSEITPSLDAMADFLSVITKPKST